MILEKNEKTDYFRKLIRAGNVYYLYEYEEKVSRGFSSKRKGRANAPFTSAETKLENQRKKAARARKTVQRAVNANPALNKFLTLTYAENVAELDRARQDFDKFVKRIKTRFSDFKYIVVIEFQKRGAIHFHLLCNLPYIDVKRLAQIWGFGFIKINRIDNVDNVGAYITKYMTKDNIDPRLTGKKCYSMSRGLNLPEEITEPEKIDEIINALRPVRAPYVVEFETEHYGFMRYTQYICARPRLGSCSGSGDANFAVEHRSGKIGRNSSSSTAARFRLPM